MKLDNIILDFEKLKTHQNYIKILCNQIETLNLNKRKIACEKLIDFIKNNNLNYAYPWILNKYGWTLYYLGDIEKSIKIQEEALCIFKEEDDVSGILYSVNALIPMYCFKKNFEKATEYGIYGIELAQDSKNYERLAAIKNNIGIVYLEIEDYQNAKELFEQNLNLPHISSDKNNISTYTNLGECERELNNFEKSLEYLKKALEVANNNHYSPWSIILEMIKTYIAQGSYDLADEELKKYINALKEKESYKCEYDYLIVSSDLDIKRHNYEQAIEKLKIVEGMQSKINSNTSLKNLYYNFNLAYKAIGNFEKAHYYLNKTYEIESYNHKISKLDCIKWLDKEKEEEEKNVYKLLYNQTQQLYSLVQRITSNLNKENIYDFIAQEIENLIKCDLTQIAIINETENTLEYPLCIEVGKRVQMESMQLEEESFGGYVIKHKKEILINDLAKEYYMYFSNLNEYIEKTLLEQNSLTEEFPKSCIFVPIMVNEHIIGVISAQSYEKNSFNLSDVNTLKILSTYMGIALENARLYKEVENSANYDSLTKLLTRREALRKIQEVYDMGDLSNYIAMIDIDNFKNINDTYGHQMGDKVLETISSTIKSTLRKDDIIGRYGGEEFIAIINADDDNYLNIVERIRKNIEDLKIKSESDDFFNVTVSIGVSKLDSKEKSLQQTINESDIALYEAKNTGKNKVVKWNKFIKKT